MPRIDVNRIWEIEYFYLVRQRNKLTKEATFKKLGVTGKQWNKYVQTGRLSVRPVVAAKLDVISSCFHGKVDPSMLPVLFKIIEVRHGGSS
jgi:hypothetical protein